MALFRTLVLAAAVAGAIAGLALTAIQHVSTVPLILKAETFEAKPAPGAAHEPGSHASGSHEHGPAAWAPADGIERIAYTALANVVGGIGLALLLLALSEAGGGLAGWRQGLLWGLGGFAAFTLAPSLSLPPELPGMPSADLLARQLWWVATVALTAGGLALIAFRRALWAAVLGIALIVAPHVVGAPHPASFDSPVPHELAQRFVAGVVVSGLLFWALLGGCAGFLRARLAPAP
jgi:cobalt transporter subunit CbtA